MAFDLLSPGPSVRHKKHHQRLLRAAQPADLREGVTNAYVVVKEVPILNILFEQQSI